MFISLQSLFQEVSGKFFSCCVSRSEKTEERNFQFQQHRCFRVSPQFVCLCACSLVLSMTIRAARCGGDTLRLITANSNGLGNLPSDSRQRGDILKMCFRFLSMVRTNSHTSSQMQVYLERRRSDGSRDRCMCEKL